MSINRSHGAEYSANSTIKSFADINLSYYNLSSHLFSISCHNMQQGSQRHTYKSMLMDRWSNGHAKHRTNYSCYIYLLCSEAMSQPPHLWAVQRHRHHLVLSETPTHHQDLPAVPPISTQPSKRDPKIWPLCCATKSARMVDPVHWTSHSREKRQSFNVIFSTSTVIWWHSLSYGWREWLKQQLVGSLVQAPLHNAQAQNVPSPAPNSCNKCWSTAAHCSLFHPLFLTTSNKHTKKTKAFMGVPLNSDTVISAAVGKADLLQLRGWQVLGWVWTPSDPTSSAAFLYCMSHETLSQTPMHEMRLQRKTPQQRFERLHNTSECAVSCNLLSTTHQIVPDQQDFPRWEDDIWAKGEFAWNQRSWRRILHLMWLKQ